MTDDIAGLIAGVLWKEMEHGELHPDTASKAVAAALSRLTAPPPTKEIAGLIAELKARAHERAGKNSMVEVEQLLEWQAADALTRLTTPPLPASAKEKAEAMAQELHIHGIDFDNNRRLALDIIAKFFATPPLPEEIAGLIERLHRHPNLACMDAIEVLRAMAQESHSLTIENNSLDEELSRKTERIRELEAERDEAKADYLRRHKYVGDQMDRRIKAETERDDLVAQLHVALASVGHNQGVADAIRAKTITELIALMDKSKTWVDFERAIRALAQAGEEKTEREE